jgi:hypothetical protein
VTSFWWGVLAGFFGGTSLGVLALLLLRSLFDGALERF